MTSATEIIKRNRQFFKKMVSISDQKNINFSASNVQISEIVDLIISFASKRGRKR